MKNIILQHFDGELRELDKLSITNIQEYIDDLFHLENILSPLDDLVIIVKNEPNESLIKAVQNIWEQQKIFVILYNIKRLQFNILDHSLVPPHRVLTEDEGINIKKKYISIIIFNFNYFLFYISIVYFFIV